MTHSKLLPLLLAGCFIFTGCPDDEKDPQDMTTQDMLTPDLTEDMVIDQSQDMPSDLSGDMDMDGDMVVTPTTYPIEDCDPLDPRQCAYPWPSNLYLAPDDARQTGYTLTFGKKSLPKNRFRRHIDPTPFERLDGYGLGVSLHVVFPNIDLNQLATEEHIERSIEADAKIVWFAISPDGTATHVPYWVELDARETDPEQRVLYVRPAIILSPKTRYVVAFRDIKDTQGNTIEPSEAFAKLRDNDTKDTPTLAPRQRHFDDIFERLEKQNIPRANLTLAWDFVTASNEALLGDMLNIRDDGLQRAGANGPTLVVTETKQYIQTDDGSGMPQNDHIAYQLRGHFMAPNYLNTDKPREVLNRNAQGQVIANGERKVNFIIRIPHSALEGQTTHLMIYGHGLFGDRNEIKLNHIGKLANDYGYIIVATDLYGMSAGDSSIAQDTVLDVSNFVTVGNRLHQGLLEYLLMARATKQRLQATLDALNITTTLDSQHIYYFGASQGGIFGPSYMALSTDTPRGYLAVPGNNYAIMLDRSVNFDQFEEGLTQTYPETLSRRLIVSILQLHWDRTEAISYLRHIKKSPLANTPPHDIILAASKGDYQVPVVTNEHATRTDLGIPILGQYDATRTPWNIPTAPYPHTGSGYILWDFGNPWPTDRFNQPPNDGLTDSHSRQAEVDQIGQQMDTFFKEGKIIDICQSKPCTYPLDSQ